MKISGPQVGAQIALKISTGTRKSVDLINSLAEQVDSDYHTFVRLIGEYLIMRLNLDACSFRSIVKW